MSDAPEKWYGSVRHQMAAFFAHPFSLSCAFRLGQELRRRFDARQTLQGPFAAAHDDQIQVILITPQTKAEDAWFKLLTLVHGNDAVTPETVAYVSDQRAWWALADAAHVKGVVLPLELWQEVFAGPARLEPSERAAVVLDQHIA